MTRRGLNWHNVDWAGTLASSAPALIGGRIGAAIQLAASLWAQLGPEENQRIANELERSAIASSQPDPLAIAGPLGLSEEDEIALELGLILMRDWHKSGIPNLSDYLQQLTDSVAQKRAQLRASLARTIYDPIDIRIICRDAGLDLARLTLQGSAEHQWFTILEYLRTQPIGFSLLLLYLASQRAPSVPDFRVWQEYD